MTDSAVVVHYPSPGPNPTAYIRQLLLSGRGGPGLGKPWTGTGITSSQVQADVLENPNSTSVAYADNATLPLGPYATFRGEPVGKTAVLIGYTRTGDANLDGVVSDDDVTIVGAITLLVLRSPPGAGRFRLQRLRGRRRRNTLRGLLQPHRSTAHSTHRGSGRGAGAGNGCASDGRADHCPGGASDGAEPTYLILGVFGLFGRT